MVIESSESESSDTEEGAGKESSLGGGYQSS